MHDRKVVGRAPYPTAAALITAPRNRYSPSSNAGTPRTSTSTHSRMDSRSSASLPSSVQPDRAI